jgi:hypothetical protein
MLDNGQSLVVEGCKVTLLTAERSFKSISGMVELVHGIVPMGSAQTAEFEWVLWGPRLTTRDSRYAYNSRSQETVVNPHNRVGISDYNIHYITSIKVLHKPLG